MPDLDRVESLFHVARALPEEDRASWLTAECAGDEWLFKEVSTLLKAQAQMEGAKKAAIDGPPRALFGAYRAIRLLGRGG